MKKVIFIAVETILQNKIEFELFPNVIKNMVKLQLESNCEFVLLQNEKNSSNQTNNSVTILLKILYNEGFQFNTVLKHSKINFEEKINDFISKDYSSKDSFLILSEELVALPIQNSEIQSILFSTSSFPSILENIEFHSNNWAEITEFICLPQRSAEVSRKTNETEIYICVNLDKNYKSVISTGLHFFDHMLEQIARHSGCGLTIQVTGDLHVDEHHTVEDTGIALGEAFLKAIGNKLGIERYGFLLPMDDCLSQVAIDFSGRPWLVWDVEFQREKVGDLPTEMVYHFFKSFSDAARCNLNIKAEGQNEHHKIEAIFKGVAKAIKMAIKRDINNMQLPSTKGTL